LGCHCKEDLEEVSEILLVKDFLGDEDVCGTPDVSVACWSGWILGDAERHVCHDSDESMFFDCEGTGVEIPLYAKCTKYPGRHVSAPEIPDWIGDELSYQDGYTDCGGSHGEESINAASNDSKDAAYNPYSKSFLNSAGTMEESYAWH
jgi:hypothetical protein